VERTVGALVHTRTPDADRDPTRRSPGIGFTRKTDAVVAHTYGYDFAAAFAHDLSSHIGRVPQDRLDAGRTRIERANAIYERAELVPFAKIRERVSESAFTL
jgi:hypothetical protein